MIENTKEPMPLLFFRGLSNRLKIDIILALKKRNMNVSQLGKELRVEQSKLSHALASLKHCSIVHCERKGKNMVYSLNKDTILPILKLIDKHVNKYSKKT